MLLYLYYSMDNVEGKFSDDHLFITLIGFLSAYADQQRFVNSRIQGLME
jgi:hypothetical protein